MKSYHRNPFAQSASASHRTSQCSEPSKQNQLMNRINTQEKVNIQGDHIQKSNLKGLY